jgi:hypothetical protein
MELVKAKIRLVNQIEALEEADADEDDIALLALNLQKVKQEIRRFTQV